jgi:hydrogenase nickel incorporation protein HypA/HybF
MHEMSIAISVIDAVRTEAAKHPGSRPSKVGLRVGELAAIDASSLEFCFEALLRGTDLEQLRLAIESRPRRHRCLGCTTEFEIKHYEFHCPHCGELRSEYVSGDELEIAYLEMEEHEPSPA